MKKLVVTLAVFAAAAFATTVFAANDQVKGTPHDLSVGTANLIHGNDVEICIYCHTPHHANASAKSGTEYAPLWNRKVGGAAAGTGTYVATYTMYNSTYSPTINMTVAATPNGISLACLSCHDGQLALGDILNGYNASAPDLVLPDTMTDGNVPAVLDATGKFLPGSTPYVGQDLTGSHPISITYDPTVMPNDFNAIKTDAAGDYLTANASDRIPLYGSGASKDQVECASCHNPHNHTYNDFLRTDNTSSALCTACHIK